MLEPLVFLPDMMADIRLFMPQIMAFSAERSVHVAPMTLGDTIEQISASVLAAAPAKFALVGLSLGGIVAMDVLRRAPDRVTRVCLMSTNPQSETPSIAAEREPMIVAAGAGRLQEAVRDMIRPTYLAPGPGRVEVMNLVMDMGMSMGKDVFVRQSRALQRRPDQQKTLRTIRCPALVLCGAHDALCPVRRHEFMAQLIPYAKLNVLADAGHLPTLEQPDEVNRALRDWLAAPLVLR
ncbi:alpha/beta fold hydrolase [Pseudogemmobacter sp. W21_MBD1_M6]|uniref:alpha/beta fold hydrolase n=1 Tax=Pseudogemmobacter sp. W21_MBD1_M6 TaxID=3240271 RepID=UPI003F979249